MYKHEEEILAIKKTDIETELENGITEDKEKMEKIFKCYEKHMFTARRGDIEYNPEYVQPVCYIVVKKGAKYYTYERLIVGGEINNFYGVQSIGVGGHMNPNLVNKSFEELVYYNMEKEIKEEIIMSAKETKFDIFGLLIDDSNLTNSCHIGIIGILEVSEETVISEREIELLNGRWLEIDELKEDEVYHNLESWSQLFVDFLEKKGLSNS